MTAATKDRDTQEMGARLRSGPMAAGVKIYAGTMTCIDASGYYTKGATSNTSAGCSSSLMITILP